MRSPDMWPAGWDGTAQVAKGLSEEEAARRLTEYGLNTIGTRPPPPLWRRLSDQMRDPLMLVLLAAAALTLLTGDHPDTIIILLVIGANTAIGLTQEVRAERAIAALAELSAPAARVIRDGQEREVPSVELVPGDVVLLGEGDLAPADGKGVEAAGLLVDESSLTGESVPVDKIAADGPEHSTMVSGTVVVRGRGRAIITATGAASTIGRLASLMDTAFALTPLQRRLAGLGRILAVVTVALCAVVLALGLLRGQPLELMIVAAISLAVAAVPESLPAVVTLGLALGARRMADRHAVIRRLPAVETLGSVTVIATDKTGTLTEGRMVVERLWTAHGEATVTGIGYVPQGHIVRAGSPVTPEGAPDLVALLRAGVLCNDARLSPPSGDDGSWKALGDPTEAALLTAGAKLGLERPALERDLPRIHEIPFDSGRKRMTTVHRLPGGGARVVCKGAPEAVLQHPVLDEDGELLAQAVTWAEEAAGAGYRVLAIAAADRPAHIGCPEDWESGLALLGLVAILDPPRSQAKTTIRAMRAAGITPLVITGDHPRTAQAIAERLDITATDRQITTGERIRQGTAGPLTDVRVYARTTPEQKLDIVEAWRHTGHVVAMTGDGVNDGPALRRADIGVAMGRRGTEVARQAADMVLADDDLATLVSAVEEGRRIYANIRRFLLYALAGGAAEILVMLAGPFMGMALPLLPAQILWINLLTHGVPGVALGAEPSEPDAMRRPPRSPREGVLGAGLWQRVAFMASFIGLITLLAALWARHAGYPWQTLIFLVLGAAQFGAALASRARPDTLGNPFLLLAVGVAVLLQVGAVYLPALQDLLGTRPLPPSCLLVAFVLFVLSYVVMRLQALWGRSRTLNRDT